MIDELRVENANLEAKNEIRDGQYLTPIIIIGINDLNVKLCEVPFVLLPITVSYGQSHISNRQEPLILESHLRLSA